MSEQPQSNALLSTIKYHELSKCIGQKFVIHGVETIESDVQRELKCGLPTALELQGEAKFRQQQLAKHAFLDLRFVVQEEIAEMPFVTGKEALDYLHFNAPIPKNEMSISLARHFREVIVEDLAQNRWYVLLWLRTEPHSEIDSANRQGQTSMALNPFPEDYFPRTFLVEDACLTNTHYAWLARHFYV